ncbi:MAG: DUF6628 family protein [Novosphingobium sp.]
MSDHPRCQLPLPLPDDEVLRLVLRIMRRMAAHGLRDAQAALLAIDGFGQGFRRPLVLLRAFVAELAQSSRRRITVAPSCALRMTLDEARLIGVLATASHAPDCARAHLRDLADRHDVCHPLSAALAIASALGDLGRPLPRMAATQRVPD